MMKSGRILKSPVAWPTRKQFFFEKKNQKTFISFVRPSGSPGSRHAEGNSQKFFGSFFQKRTACLPH
jgi:hypothetical protein